MSKKTTRAARGAETFPQRLQRLREGAGITRPALAEAVGMSPVSLWALEARPETSNPKLSTIVRISRVLGISFGEFLDGIEWGDDEMPAHGNSRRA